MVRTATLVTIIACAISTSAYAEPVLWRTLQAGDSPDAAKAKLEAMPEIAKVKNVLKKKVFARQDINMRDEGVPVFEGHFSLSTAYTDEKLAGVSLMSGGGCSRDGYPLVEKIDAELLKKYPNRDVPGIAESDYNHMSFAASSSRPEVGTSAYLGTETAALMLVTFSVEEPPSYSGGGKLARALYDISRSMYDSRSEACGGGHVRTSKIEVIYLTRAAYDQKKADVSQRMDDDRAKASSNL